MVTDVILYSTRGAKEWINGTLKDKKKPIRWIDDLVNKIS